jgi:pilus assembly protein CpaE
VQNVLMTGSRDEQVLTALRERQLRAVPVELADFGRLTGQEPDAIVIDIRSLDRLPKELAGMRRQFPAAGLVILARTLDSAALLEAMRMGVNEWIAEPLVLDELVAAIRRVARPSTPVTVGKTFALIGAKGGVGGTTVAVNLATSMTLVSKDPTLLIDLHPAYGDTAVFLGVEPRFSVADALENIDRLDATYLRSLIATTPAGIDLLASGYRLPSTSFEVTRIRRLLELASSIYPFVVLDCARTEPAVLEALDAVTEIVVVANQELPTLRSAARLVSHLRQRCGPDRVKVAITRFDPKGDIGRSDIERALGGAVSYQFPNDYRTSIGAIARGEPLSVANHSQLAHSIDKFARQLGGFQPPKKDTSKNGLFGLLGGRK